MSSRNAPTQRRWGHLFVWAALALAKPAEAQRSDLTGTWQLADGNAPPVFERAPVPAAPACDPTEARLGLLQSYAQPSQRLILTHSDTTLIVSVPDGATSTFYLDGRETRFALGPVQVTRRGRWIPERGLVTEWKPDFGGSITNSYISNAGGRLLAIEQLIEHPALARSVRQRFAYERLAEVRGDSGQAPGQVADTAFRPVVARPAYAASAGPVVMIDEAHANFHTASGRYLPFAQLLRRDGYVVNSSTPRLSPEILRAGKVLVVANAMEPFTPDEVSAVRAWVAGGGSLLLITDHPPFVGAAVDLARAFGIRLRDETAADPEPVGRLTFRRSDSTLADHPITRGIDEVVTFTGSSFQIDANGQPLLVFGPRTCSSKLGPNPVSLRGHLQGAVMQVGAGRVAVFSEAAMFSAQVWGANRSPMGMNVPVAGQNAQFLLNVMHWLTGAP